MKKAEAFLNFILDQLRETDGISARAMFGGHGIYRNGTMCGIVYKGRFYLKVGRATKAKFEKAGMGAFQPTPTQTLKSYREVPADVVESPSELARWVRPD